MCQRIGYTHGGQTRTDGAGQHGFAAGEVAAELDAETIGRHLGERGRQLDPQGQRDSDLVLRVHGGREPGLDDGEARDAIAMAAQQLQRAFFGAAHHAFFGGLEVVVASEVEPAMDDVERELGGEGGEEFLRKRT